MTKRLDPARDDAGVRLRTARRRRDMTQTALAELGCVSPSFVSMVETGQRELTRVCDVVALADVLKVSPLYLADGRDDTPRRARGLTRTVPSPARCRSDHAGPAPAARQLSSSGLARHDGHAAGDWLRRLAREPGVHPWLLLDQPATLLPYPRSSHKELNHHDPHAQSYPPI